MKLAFSTLGCPDWTLKYSVDQAKKFGFQAIEIRGIKECLRADTIEELLPENLEASLRYADENIWLTQKMMAVLRIVKNVFDFSIKNSC